VASYAGNPQAADLISKLSVQPDSVPHFTLTNGVIRFKNRIWLGDNKALHDQLLTAFHCSALEGHSGFPAAYSKLK
jgi:hypothetical protein